MKKLFTLFISFLALGTAAYAQEETELDGTFQFVDEEGNVVPDGTVLTISELDEDGMMAVPLYVKNVSGAKAAVSMFENLDEKPNGDFQTCAFGNCMILNETGYSPKSIVGGDYYASIQTEWIPEEEEYASWTATLQIHVFNITQKIAFGQQQEVAGDVIIGYGPKVTVKFIYADPPGIHAIPAATDRQAVYALDGRHLAGQQKGLNVVRMGNGKTIKQIVK